jgi:hypothetical protein
MPKSVSPKSKKLSQREKIRCAPLPNVLAAGEFVPQAVIKEPVDRFARPNARIFSDTDDLDQYKGIGFYVGRVPFTIMHYRGHPPRTSTIYFPHNIKDVEQISTFVQRILTHFNLPKSAILWERNDDPAL